MVQLYDHFSAADFLTDDAFVSHQLTPTEQSHAFWTAWLRQHPDRATEWQQAVKLVESLRLGLDDYARTYLSEEAVEQLLIRIQATNRNTQQEPFVVQRSLSWVRWVAAACLLLAAGAGLWWLNIHRFRSPYERQLAAVAQPITERVNSTGQLQEIVLPDGSTVALSPGSRISFITDTTSINRMVYLTGEATFSVVKNARKPFLVYAGELVTKVLGTKFTVRAFEREANINVDVASGQVSVYREGGAATKADRKGVLLHANQLLVFTRKSEQFDKRLTHAPRVVLDRQVKISPFLYDETPVALVFAELEKAYNIQILFNKTALARCQLSASLADESFEQKLTIICKTIGAEYEVIDGQVVISGGDCR
ncbi:FecR family protein [Fibrella forsythiae]|uniref:FecR family protein n=1 Tax=Fibrella forsythiae TaxID=2817061 RepID=A0ABS3JHS4_9BACT|nr:FecR family protein [Fibrella forsythiae]MBO0948958.1 FecR family protein [Fibrella forsythiae]